MMRTRLRIALVLLMAGGIAVAGLTDEKRSDAAHRTKSKREAIHAEVQKLGPHDWAGDYYAGDGLGVNQSLILAPGSGYVFEWHGCLGLYDRNYGPVTRAGDRIRLSFTFENERQGFRGIAPELIPVSWGPRRYLIPADDVVGFCNEINQGQEPRNAPYGLYLMRRGDEKLAVEGVPKLPAEYQRCLLAKPVEAAIIIVGPFTTRDSIVDWKFKDTPVTLDAGSDQGLLVGMKLIAITPQNVFDTIRITKVEPNRAEAIITQAPEDTPGPKIGWRVSTRAPWADGK